MSPSHSKEANAAVYAAGKSSDVTFLVNALTDVDMRLGAASWLGDLGAASAVPALIRNLRVRNDLDRNSAVVALRKIGDPSAVLPLLELAQDDEAAGVRVTAIEAVAALGDERGVRMLTELAIDPAAVLGSCSRNMDVRPIRALRPTNLRTYCRWAAKRLIALHAVRAADDLEAALPSVGYWQQLRLRRTIRALRQTETEAV